MKYIAQLNKLFFYLTFCLSLTSIIFSESENNKKIIRAEDVVVKRIISIKSLTEIEKDSLGLQKKDYAISNGNILEIKSADGITKETIQLVRPSFYGRDDKISPNGEKVASLTMDKNNKTTHIVINNIRNNSFPDLMEINGIEESFNHFWSHNSKFLTFYGRTNKNDNYEWNLYLLNIQLESISMIAKFPLGDIIFSNNDKYIFFKAKKYKGGSKRRIYDLYRHEIYTGLTKQITNGTMVNGVYPSPEGGKVITSIIDPLLGIGHSINTEESVGYNYAQNKKGSLIFIDIEKNIYSEIYNINTVWGAHEIGEQTVSWSPNGNLITFCKINNMVRGNHGEFIPSKTDLYIGNSDGTGITNISNTLNVIESSPIWINNSTITFFNSTRFGIKPVNQSLLEFERSKY